MTQNNSAHDLGQVSSGPILVDEPPKAKHNLEKRRQDLKTHFYKRSTKKQKFLSRLIAVVEEAFLEPFTTPVGKFLAFGYICMLAGALLLVSISYVFSNLLGPVQVIQVISLDPTTISFLNKCFNLILYAFPAFIVATIGSATRLLLSDAVLGIRKSVKLLFGSGCFGILAFLSIESGIVVEFLTNAYAVQSTSLAEPAATSKAFYKTILVCFMTGMFSTIIFITIDEKVKMVSSKVLSKKDSS